MLLVTFAVPHESRFFRRSSAAASVRILHTGIGEDASRHMLHDALDRERPSTVISSGFAGALDPSLHVGDLVADDAVSSPELFSDLPSSIRRGRIHTSFQAVDSPAAKAQLHRETGALAVDMETSAVAEVCAAAGIPLLALRVISDAATDTIPVPLQIAWNMQHQRPRPFGLAAYLAFRPRQIGPFIAFLRKTNTAAERLGESLAKIVSKKSPQHCQ